MKTRIADMLLHVRIAWCVLLAASFVSGPVTGQEEGDSPEDPVPEAPAKPPPFEVLLELSGVQYIPPAKEGGEQTLVMKFDLSPDVPRGAKLNVVVEQYGLPVEEATTWYTLKDENRRGLSHSWKPKARLPTGEYFLRVHCRLEEQLPAVQRAIKGKPERFPLIEEPWSWYYIQMPLKVGSPEEEAREAEELCNIYTGFMDRAIDNMVDFIETMEAVKAGDDYVNGKSLDTAKFEAYVLEWRKKQGELQKDIVEFGRKEPVMIQKSATAYTHLVMLGRMVSARSVKVQNEVTDQYKVGVINPASHKYFDRSFRYKADLPALQSRLDTLRRLLNCPEEGEESEPGEAEAAPAGAPQEAPPGEDAEKKPEEAEDAPADEDPPAEPTKKAPAKKAPPKKK
ncbi:MAG TPA: hypothetical protein VMT52_18505 [Planctomycetota bacterium]|nr:hypothetical protein [Planctomycetota bacterium]